ncbi:hypothetical protein Tco_0088307 [Tanacetum coccineum]
MNKVRSIEPLENPLDTRKLESSSYHAHGACLSPYKSLLETIDFIVVNGFGVEKMFCGNCLEEEQRNFSGAEHFLEHTSASTSVPVFPFSLDNAMFVQVFRAIDVWCSILLVQNVFPNEDCKSANILESHGLIALKEQALILSYTIWSNVLHSLMISPIEENGDAGYRSRDNTRRTVPVETSDALVVQDNALIVQDGLGYDWSYIAQDEPTEFALMAYTSNSSGSDTEVQSCSKNCVKTYEKLQKQFDEQRQTLSKANLEIVAYQLGLESVEAQLVVHQKNEVVYEENITVLEFEVKDKRYGDQLNENDSSGSELFNSVFDSRSSDRDDNQTNDRFKKDNRYHVVPPPLTGNYMPPLADLSFAGLDDSVYRPTTNKTSASVSQVSDDEDIFQPNDDVQTTVKPSFKKIEFTKARNEPVKSDKQAVKPRMVTQSPKVDRKDWNGKMTQKLGLGFGFTKKACFVCGSHNHLIKDCDFHEKRMSKKSVLNDKGKGTGHREVRPIWNNTQRINHQNKFVPTAVLTRSRRIPVSTAKQYVNTATPKNRVNVSKSKINTFPKSHSPIRRPFYKSIVLNTRVLKEKVNTVRVNGVNTAGQTAVSTAKGNGVTAVKASASCVWRPKQTDLNNGSKDNSGSWISKRGNPQQALKYKGMFDSGCSRHMTGNKALLTDYQDIDGDFVAFGGSTKGGKITGIGKIRTNKIDFEDVFFVKELKFNLFSVSQMCDKKNSVLFTETECLVLSLDFKLIDESQVLLRVPGKTICTALI